MGARNARQSDVGAGHELHRQERLLQVFWRRVAPARSQQDRSGVRFDRAWRRGPLRHRDSARSGSRRDRQAASPGLSVLLSGGGPMTLDRFTASYIEAALWSSMDESTPEGGE